MAPTMRWQLRDFLITNRIVPARIEAMIEKLTKLGLKDLGGLDFVVQGYETREVVQRRLVSSGFEEIDSDALTNAILHLRRVPAAALQPPSADRKSTRLNSSHYCATRMTSSAWQK